MLRLQQPLKFQFQAFWGKRCNLRQLDIPTASLCCYRAWKGDRQRRKKSDVLLLLMSTCRSWEVCVCVLGGICLSADRWECPQTFPNSNDLICITLSICTHAPSFQQHPWGQTAAAWECLLPHLLAVRTGLFFTLQPLIYSQKSLVLKTAGY